MAYTQECEINGFKMKITFEIINIDRNAVAEELKSKGFKETDENIDSVINEIKNNFEPDLENSSVSEFINGEDGGFAGRYTIFDNAIDNLSDSLEEE
ncbi:MAG: hypothetical protein K0R18_266 [Bacillales bacterium]|jgi:hypothetical protein|nr:hypothetical protein [Bacillales bacterium]